MVRNLSQVWPGCRDSLAQFNPPAMHKSRYKRKIGDAQRLNMSDALATTLLAVMTNAELRILKRNIDVLLAQKDRKPRL